MLIPKTAPYGWWKSPLTSDLIAAQSISLSEPRLHSTGITTLLDLALISPGASPLGYPEGLQCTEVPLTDFEADIFQAAVAQVLQFSSVIMALPAK